MKKALLSLSFAFTLLTAYAQTDMRILNHLSVGASVGLQGLGVDLSVPVTQFVDVQAGFSAMPRFKFNVSLDPSRTEYAAGGMPSLSPAPMKGRLTMMDGKVLVNVMPLPMLTSLHVTVGVFFGNGNIMEIYSPEPLTDLATANKAIDAYNALNPEQPQQYIGMQLGHYTLMPDEGGNIFAQARVNKVKPYVGIGIGRGVPKRRIGFKVDLGCIIWGKPTLYCNGAEALRTDGGGIGGGVTRIISKLPVYPILNIRICGKLF